MKRSKSSREVLSTPSRLNGLVNKANYLAKLNNIVVPLLPSPLALHCVVANVRNGVLILHVDSASWGTQLRYLIPDLLTQLRSKKTLAQIRSIEYKVRPAAQPKPTITKEPPILSADNKLLLAELKSLLQKKP